MDRDSVTCATVAHEADEPTKSKLAITIASGLIVRKEQRETGSGVHAEKARRNAHTPANSPAKSRLP
jgi:hypothetical protein